MVALIFGKRGPRFRPKFAVDLTTVVALLREDLLNRGHVRIAGLISIAVLIVRGARIVVTLVVIVLIRIAVAIGVIIGRGVPIRIEPEIEDKPCTAEIVATMTV